MTDLSLAKPNYRAQLPDSSPTTDRLEGVVIGVVAGFETTGEPLVVFPGSRSPLPVPAASSAHVAQDDLGCEVALMFLNGSPDRPIIIGKMINPSLLTKAASAAPREQKAHALVDGEKIEFSADQEIVLKCGKASITLTKAGKVLIRGAYIFSRSSGAHRIKGGSVQIN